MSVRPAVHVVEDDVILARSLVRLFSSVQLDTVSYASPSEFLERFDPRRPGCIVVDVRLPGMSGLDLQARIRERNWSHPIVFLSAHGDIATAVRAIKAGAVDFIEKPANDQRLLDTVARAINGHVQHCQAEEELARIRRRVGLLSPREREVLQLVVAGLSTKQIAGQLGLSHKTVDNHRASILDKMQVSGVVELVRAVLLLGEPDLTTHYPGGRARLSGADTTPSKLKTGLEPAPSAATTHTATTHAATTHATNSAQRNPAVPVATK